MIALLMQAQGGAAPEGAVASSTSIVRLVRESNPISQGVLLMLLLLSIISWGIILYKLWTYRAADKHTAQFLDVFRRSSKFSEVQAVCRSLNDSPLVGLFQSGYAELTAQLRQAAPEASNGPNPRPPAGRPTLKSLAAVDRALMRASVVEINKLERRVSFLATTASIAPFVGLFGTVWGIIIAFDRISQTGSTNLAVVAPGIAEALLATAIGLVAAIPAVVIYNVFSRQIASYRALLADASAEVLRLVGRDLDRAAAPQPAGRRGMTLSAAE